MRCRRISSRYGRQINPVRVDVPEPDRYLRGPVRHRHDTASSVLRPERQAGYQRTGVAVHGGAGLHGERNFDLVPHDV